MKRLLIGVSALALAGLTGTAARADTDPGAAVTADLTQLVSDATALHDAVTADANTIATDADAKASRAALRADYRQVQSDRQRLVPPVRADWKQLSADLKAARAAKVSASALRPALQQATQQLKQEVQDVATALKAAHQATLALRHE